MRMAKFGSNLRGRPNRVAIGSGASYESYSGAYEFSQEQLMKLEELENQKAE